MVSCPNPFRSCTPLIWAFVQYAAIPILGLRAQCLVHTSFGAQGLQGAETLGYARCPWSAHADVDPERDAQELEERVDSHTEVDSCRTHIGIGSPLSVELFLWIPNLLRLSPSAVPDVSPFGEYIRSNFLNTHPNLLDVRLAEGAQYAVSEDSEYVFNLVFTGKFENVMSAWERPELETWGRCSLAPESGMCETRWAR